MTEYGVKANQVDFNASGKIINVSSYLNVRSSPSTNSSILGTLKNNDSITIVMKTEETLPWYGFYYGDNLGWVRSDFVEILFYGVPATAVELNRKSLMLKVGEEYQLTARVSPDYANQSITWSSSNSGSGSNGGNSNTQPEAFPSRRYFSNKFGNNWVYPTKGKVTAVFPRYSNGEYHNGTDIASLNGASGQPIYAVGDGEIVVRKELTTSYGKYLVIKHREGVYSLYAHNNTLLVNLGDKVTKGQQIATMGSTGRSEGPHCHLSFLTQKPPTAESNYVEPISGIKLGEVISW